jgi:hypothetical protein
MDKIRKLILHWKKKSIELNKQLEREIDTASASLSKL